MDQMELLWQFQQEDMKLERIANSMKLSPARQNAEKARQDFYDQKKRADAINEQVINMADRKDAIKDAINRCAEQIAALQQKLQNEKPATPEEIHELLAEAERYRKTITDYEQELTRMNRQSTEMVSRMQKISLAAAQAKKDFEIYKKQYQAEMEHDSSSKKEELEKQHAVVNELATKVDVDLLERYTAIKKHILPAVARLVGGTCSGCNTNPPSAMQAKINAGTVVECETCGRLLIR